MWFGPCFGGVFVCVVCVWDALHKSIGVVAEQEQWEEKKAYSTHCSQVVAHPSTK